MSLTLLVFHKDVDNYQAVVGNDRITVNRTTFDKAVYVHTREYVNGGMAEIPDAYVRARAFMLIAEYWISSEMDGVSIMTLNEQ